MRTHNKKLTTNFAVAAVAAAIIAPTISHAAPAIKTPQLYNAEECAGNINWSAVGLTDGKLGMEASYFNYYTSTCAKQGKTVDKAAYFKARSQGLVQYCDPQNIYEIAKTGQVAIGACENTPALQRAMQKGFEESH